MEQEPEIIKISEVVINISETAFKNFDKRNVANINIDYFDMFKTVTQTLIKNILINELNNFKGIKFMVGIYVAFYKYGNTERIDIKPFIRTKNITLLNENDINMDKIYNQLLINIENYQQEGSGWIWDKIDTCEVNTSKYAPLRGSSYIDLPAEIKNKKYCVNVKNNDNRCFEWAILSALYQAKDHSDRVNNYECHRTKLNVNNILFPVKISDISKFEKLNNININVYGYDGINKVYPLYITENKYEQVIYLLLINKDENNH